MCFLHALNLSLYLSYFYVFLSLSHYISHSLFAPLSVPLSAMYILQTPLAFVEIGIFFSMA